MSNKLNNLAIRVYLALQKLERGDADSSGSTLRTVGIVALVLLVVAVLGVAIYSAANSAATNISSGSFTLRQAAKRSCINYIASAGEQRDALKSKAYFFTKSEIS